MSSAATVVKGGDITFGAQDRRDQCTRSVSAGVGEARQMRGKNQMFFLPNVEKEL